MAAGRRLVVEIVGDTRQLQRALSGTQSSMRKVGRAAGLLGGAIAAGLGVAAKIGFDELRDSQSVMAQTEAVIKSTGGAANVTAKHVDTMSQSLLQLTGVDDELISSAQNVLLTFRNVHNEVGKGNDIFDQATKATLDFAEAMDLDLDAAALGVGKALNDPIKGLTRLGRMGVTFSEKQKTLITRLVETGKTAEAQKVILAELNKEFGGSAAAAGELLPAQLSRAREAFADVSAGLITQLLPSITALLTHLARLLTFLKEHPAVAKAVAIAIAALSVALLTLSVASTIAAASLTALWIASGIGVLVALAAAVVIAYQRFETFRRVVDTVVGFVKRHWQTLLLVIAPIIPLAIKIVEHWQTIKRVGISAFNAIKEPIQSVVRNIQTLIGWIGTAIDKLSILKSLKPGSGSGDTHKSGIDIPFLQHGGIVKRPTLAMIGEGGPEAVIPLSRGMRRGGSATTVVIQNHGVLGSKREVLAWFKDAMDEYARSNGGRLAF